MTTVISGGAATVTPVTPLFDKKAVATSAELSFGASDVERSATQVTASLASSVGGAAMMTSMLTEAAVTMTSTMDASTPASTAKAAAIASVFSVVKSLTVP